MGGEVVVHVEVGALGVEDLWGWMVLVFVVYVCVGGLVEGALRRSLRRALWWCLGVLGWSDGVIGWFGDW